MVTPTAPSDPIVRWCELMLTPSGCIEAVEVRSPSESLALGTVPYWSPITGRRRTRGAAR